MARDYVQLFKQGLPRGAFWQRAIDSVATMLDTGLVQEFERIDLRIADLVNNEMDPRTTTEMLEDWERNFGLPDPCTEPPTTIEGRRQALTARVIARGGWSGGPSVPFLTSLIVALGYAEEDIEIRRFKFQPYTCNSECDNCLNSDDAGWIYVWEFVVVHGTLDSVLQCQVYKYTLGHIGGDSDLMFAFPLVSLSDATFTRAGTAVFTDPVTGCQTALAANELGTVYVYDDNTDLVVFSS